jgi:hypothetical protein
MEHISICYPLTLRRVVMKPLAMRGAPCLIRRLAALGHVPSGRTGTLPTKNKSDLILPSSIAVQAK